MEIVVIRGTREAKFNRLASIISKVYNEEFNKTEEFNITEPNNIYVAHPKGIKGGVIVSKINGKRHLATVLVAGYKKSDRGKGYLKISVNELRKQLARKGLKLVAVTLNPDDNTEVWKKLGFIYEHRFNGMQHLLSVSPSELEDTL